MGQQLTGGLTAEQSKGGTLVEGDLYKFAVGGLQEGRAERQSQVAFPGYVVLLPIALCLRLYCCLKTGGYLPAQVDVAAGE